MGALSPMHLALVLVIALLVFGPKKLPEIGKELGKAIREFKRASRDVMESFHDALEDRPHPVSTYDPPALSAYHAPEDTYQQAAQASSLGEPAAADTPTIPGAAPMGTVERPAHPAAPPVAGPTTPPPAPAPPAAPSRAPGREGAGPHGSADLPVGVDGQPPTAWAGGTRGAGGPVPGGAATQGAGVPIPGGDADRKAGALSDRPDVDPHLGQDPVKTAGRPA